MPSLLKKVLCLLISCFIISCNKPGKETIVTVQSGDFLGKIAQFNRVSVNDLKLWNNLKSDNIYKGQKLKVYTKSETIGDLKFGMSPDEIITTLGIPPKGIYEDEKLKSKIFRYNVYGNNIGTIDNKSTDNLMYYDIQYVDIVFLNDKFSYMSYQYRNLNFQDFYDDMISDGFKLKEVEQLYWFGAGEIYGTKVKVSLSNMVESDVVFCSFFAETEEVNNFLKKTGRFDFDYDVYNELNN